MAERSHVQSMREPRSIPPSMTSILMSIPKSIILSITIVLLWYLWTRRPRLYTVESGW